VTRTSPMRPLTSIAGAAATTRRTVAASLFAGVLITSAPGSVLADVAKVEPPQTQNITLSKTADVDTVENQMQVEAARQLVEERIANKTAWIVDSMVQSQSTAILNGLQKLEDRSTSIEKMRTKRVNAHLTTVMSNFRAKAYAKAQTNSKSSVEIAAQQ
jgi:uncharacterized protein YifN (PemK superfamily)